MQFKCNSCGAVAEVPQYGAEGADCIGPDSPPEGWRAISTLIEEYTDDEGGTVRHLSQVLHSCDDCNTHMTVDEHLEAELDARHRAMSGRALIELPAQPPAPEPQDAIGSAPPDTLGAHGGDPIAESCDEPLCVRPRGHDGEHFVF